MKSECHRVQEENARLKKKKEQVKESACPRSCKIENPVSYLMNAFSQIYFKVIYVQDSVLRYAKFKVCFQN